MVEIGAFETKSPRGSKRSGHNDLFYNWICSSSASRNEAVFSFSKG